MALAAVVSLLAAQYKLVVPVIQTAPKITAGVIRILCFMIFKYTAKTSTEMKLLAPLIAKGDQGTILIQSPPRLNNAAAVSTKKIPP